MNNVVIKGICGIADDNFEVGTVKFTRPFRDELTGAVKKSAGGVPEWYGYVVPDKIGPDIKIHWHSGYQIHDGVDTPVFTGDQLGGFPKPGDKVVVIRRNNCGPAIFWGYLNRYEESVLKIAHRQSYRVVVTGTRFRGQFTPKRNGIITEVARGTMEQMACQYHRDSENDRLAPEFKSGPCLDIQKWQRLDRPQGLDIWVDCDDPRLKTITVTVRENQEVSVPAPVKSSTQDLDAELESLARSTSGRNSGISHQRPSEMVTA